MSLNNNKYFENCLNKMQSSDFNYCYHEQDYLNV